MDDIPMVGGGVLVAGGGTGAKLPYIAPKFTLGHIYRDLALLYSMAGVFCNAVSAIYICSSSTDVLSYSLVDII